MANNNRLLPTNRIIYENDIQGAPSWITFLLRPLNEFFNVIFGVLDRNLTFESNIRSRIIEFTSNGSNATLDIVLNDELPTPIGVIPLQIIGANGEGTASQPTVEWRQVGQTLEITKIWGLAAETEYNVRILII